MPNELNSIIFIIISKFNSSHLIKEYVIEIFIFSSKKSTFYWVIYLKNFLISLLFWRFFLITKTSEIHN